MQELIRTNDAVLISFVESLMKEAGIRHFVADQNTSIMEGSLGILARRVMVASDRADEARRILRDAGVGDELRPQKHA
ncbi:MAG: putative signal transducing protein [Pararhizobium sp.]